jgi:glycosyltransferase involved in cell wall biosynthesis
MDYVCCVSEGVRRAFCGALPGMAAKTRVFPNLLPCRDIRRMALEGGFSDGYGGLRIVTVGRLHRQKGLDIAIAAFAKLSGAYGDSLRWYVLGDGPERARLERLIKRHGLAGRFVLMGARSNPYPFVAQCDIYVQPSRFEGFPLTLQEALILHRPCVATDFDGVRDVLSDGGNARIARRTPEAIAEAIDALAKDAALRTAITEKTRDIPWDAEDQIPRLLGVMRGETWD